MKLKRFLLVIVSTFLITNILVMNPVLADALTQLQRDAADLNRDGKVNNEDIALMVQVDFPDAPKSGEARSSSDGNYIFKSSLLNVGAIGEGGEFVPVNSDNIYGYYTTASGKVHVVYHQSNSFFPGQCNRAAIASIASGYTDVSSDPYEASTAAQNAGQYMGSDYTSTTNYLSQFGLSANWINTSYASFSDVENDIITYLANGKYIMLWFPHATTGQKRKWTSLYHWISLLDIKVTDQGYAVFVSDSAGGSTQDYYGIGSGWYLLEEFENVTVQWVVSIG